MKKAELLTALAEGAQLLVSRERVSLDHANKLTTVRRSLFDALYDAEKVVFSHKHNNFTRAYKLVQQDA